MSADDEDMTPDKPDYSELSISDMLTRLQRAHIENLLALAEGGDLPNAQVLAQINRYLMDNGIVVLHAPPGTQIEGHANYPAIEGPKREPLPDYSGERYDE